MKVFRQLQLSNETSTIVSFNPGRILTSPKDIAKNQPFPNDELANRYIYQYQTAAAFPTTVKNFPDFSQRDSLRFLSLGDSGYALRKGRHYQLEVAKAMRIIMDQYSQAGSPMDFVLHNGDIFYDPSHPGVVRPSFRLTLDELRQSFLEIYPEILGPHIPIFLWPGNHEADPTRRTQGLQDAIDLSGFSNQYYMMAGHWGVPKLPDFIRIGGINSNLLVDPHLRAHKTLHAKQLKDMSRYFLDKHPGKEKRLNILVMHHPSVLPGRPPEPYSNGLVTPIHQGLSDFVEQAAIQNVYAGHVHQMVHITLKNYDLFVSGGGGAKLTPLVSERQARRYPGEQDGQKIFNFHESIYGFTVTTVNRNGSTAVDFYGFNKGQSGEDVSLLYSQVFLGFNSFGGPHLKDF